MEKLLLIALIGTCLSLLLKSVKPEYAWITATVTGALMLFSLLDQTLALSEGIQRIGERFGVSDAYARALWKMILIAYMAHFGAATCRDQGESALAAKLELGGRIGILGCALPAAVTLLETGLAFLQGAEP